MTSHVSLQEIPRACSCFWHSYPSPQSQSGSMMRLPVVFAPAVFLRPQSRRWRRCILLCQKHQSRKKCGKAECMHLCVNTRACICIMSCKPGCTQSSFRRSLVTRKAASKAGSRQQVTTCRYGTDLTLLFATQGFSPVLEAKLTCAATGGVVQRPTPVVFGGRPTRVRRRAGTAPAQEAHKNVQIVET